MTKEKIVEAIKDYLMTKNTNYAYMISGDWGIGKTHFYKEVLCTKIKEINVHDAQEKGNQFQIKYKPIYISLIGLKSREVLKEIIEEKINPFHKYKKEAPIQHEARIIENIINSLEESNTRIIPENIVLCFDDLERIDSNFIEEALGYINAFIEHNKCKVLFFCNENKIKGDIKEKYVLIKEKYIRHTLHIDTSLEEIINIQEENNQHIYLNKNTILAYFKRANSTNARTLLFIINQYPKVLEVIDNIEIEPNYKSKIIELTIKFYCFYSIEKTNGTPIDMLDYINSAKSVIGDLDFGWDNENDESPFNKPTEDEIQNQKNIDAVIDRLKNKYFKNNDDLEFERFESIAQYIVDGYLNKELLNSEIKAVVESLKAKQGTGEDELIRSIKNIYEVSDEELPDFIQNIYKEVEKGFFSLDSYLKIYSDLLWLSTFNVKAIVINKNVTDRFKRGIKEAFENKRLKYKPHIAEQFAWTGDDKITQQFNEFKRYVEGIYDLIRENEEKVDLNKILQMIENKEYDLLNKEIGTTKSVYFSREEALPLFDALKTAHPAIVNSFYQGIMNRYADENNIYSHMPRSEEGFILGLNKMVDQAIENNNGESLRIIPFKLLRNYLEKVIKRHELKNEEK